MPRFLTRRKLIGAGGAAALVPVIAGGSRVQAVPLPTMVVLPQPMRVYDSRTAGGSKLQTGSSIGVSVGTAIDPDLVAHAVFANVTVTGTEGSGYLVVRASNLQEDGVPLPGTSNVNWSAAEQTVANLVITPVGGEHTIEVHAGGAGATHVIVDVQAYVPSIVV
jgi:hypothetical protein